MRRHFFLHFLHAAFGVAAVAGFSAGVMLLWNALLPQIFGFVAINFWQSLGLLVLLAGLSKFMAVAAFLGMRGYRRNPLHEKWQKMTPDERREFIRKRHVFFHKHSFGKGGFCEESASGAEATGASTKEQ
jgi:hypothetical protein